jgi:ribonucleoside-diphosphate reductase alpha chain
MVMVGKLSENAQKVAERRYFQKNEDWEGLSNRVGKAAAAIEKDGSKWSSVFAEEIYNMYFIPAGRILRNAGSLKQCLLNCACLPIGDNIEAIGDTIRNALIAWSYGMGLGTDFSPLREKGRELVTKGGESSGVMSFIRAIDFVGSTIQTGGQRRSGLLAMLRVSHPEIFDFIKSKEKDKDLPYTELAVSINKDFICAVENEDEWNLTFAGQTVKTVKAADIWSSMLDIMISSGEPGLMNHSNLMKNNSYYFAPISCTNLCGEVPLSEYGVCCLGSLVLPNFVVNKNINWKKLEHSIHNAVRFLDNIIDINYYPIPQMEVAAKDGRRIGLGVMGLHDFLMMKEIRYGSERSISEIEKLYKFIRDTAYEVSMQLAIEKGAFPKYSRQEYNNASFVRKLPAKLRMNIKDNAIRNVCCLSGQPTGTTSLIADVSSGIEPVFSLAYQRKDRIGERYYVHPKLLQWINSNEEESPDWLVDTSDLKPEDHLEVQSIVTKYVDNSVSKTINCPKDITEDELSRLLLEYINDLKGVTVYRDGSKEGQVLNKIDIDEVRKSVERSKITSEMSEEDTKCSTGACEV